MLRRSCLTLLEQLLEWRSATCSCTSVACSQWQTALPSTSCTLSASNAPQPSQWQQHGGVTSGAFHRRPSMLHAWHQRQHGPMPALTRSLAIKTVPTPNPQSLMFVPGKTLLESGSKVFPDAEAANDSPLASRLFALNGVSSVMFGTDFITVTKSSEDITWPQLKHDIKEAIQEYLATGQPLLKEGASLAASDTAIQEDDSDVVATIKELLETRIRPAVQEDGGDILYRGFDPETGIVTVRMMGSCSGCPSSTVTLKSGVENMLQHYIPEVKGVEQEVSEAEAESDKALAQLEAKLGDK